MFDGEGVKHITTVTHAHVVERFLRTIKNGIHDRVRFNNANWEEMLPYVANKYNNTIHSSIGYKPVAIDDKYASYIKVKAEITARTKRRYPNIATADHVKVFKKAGKYGEAKESKSRWSDESYKVERIIKGVNTYYKLEGKQQ